MHFAGTLPSPNGRERIASTRCYAPASGEYNSRAYAAMPDRPMTHRGSISPAKPPFGYARGSMLVPTVPRRSVVTARARACGCNSGAHTHRRTVHSPDVPRLLQVCTASGRSRQLRARRPLSAEAFGHGPSRARGNAVGCGRYRLQGQLRCKSTNEPVHSNIFPLRY